MMADADEPSELQQALMERARLRQLDATLPAKRPSVLPKVACFAIAFCIVLAVFSGFDRFLSAMQHYLEWSVTEPVPASAPAATLPVFVVEDPQPADPAPPAPSSD